jgi:hypothetical protein
MMTSKTIRYRYDGALAPLVPDSGRRDNVSLRLQLQPSNHYGALLLVNDPSVSTALMRLTEDNPRQGYPKTFCLGWVGRKRKNTFSAVSNLLELVIRSPGVSKICNKEVVVNM